MITSSTDADNGKWIRVVGIRTGDIDPQWVYAISMYISPLPDILWSVDAARDLDHRSVEYLCVFLSIYAPLLAEFSLECMRESLVARSIEGTGRAQTI